MAVGDSASAAGMPLVPDSGDEGLVKYGAREINRTRDFIAEKTSMVPVSRGGTGAGTKNLGRLGLGFDWGFEDPWWPADDGDVFFKIL